ncbi:PREDICTED: paired amphipathic helix protein Sin3-like 5 [Lupinus angustifolius]|uniref:paired amphipathic helix protein Sin3-like 5 n=1 Tax=Lupinus angustifolius TaxID=3871 RepID=UPI00092EC6FF|nr:PREDICTED: paired amphipathic helix protein Sin3-like 5 [Lupinus angustifolius]
MASEGGRRVTSKDALSYLQEIKTAFKEEKEKYEHFLQIMKDFKEKRLDKDILVIGTNGVISATNELFIGHDHLLLGLNNFLPKGYEIQLPLINEESNVGIEDPTDFKNKVKTRFEENSHICESFLDIIKKLEEGKKSTIEAHEEIATLLEGHEDLLQELVHFLPSASGSAST